MTREPDHTAETPTRPGPKLSREMKITLTALLAVGAVGGWYAWHSAQTADPETLTPPASAAPASTSPGNAGGATSDAAPPTIAATPTNGTTNPSVSVARPQSTTIPTIPYLNSAPDTSSSDGAAGTVTTASGSDTPTLNPFRPLQLTAEGGGAVTGDGGTSVASTPNAGSGATSGGVSASTPVRIPGSVSASTPSGVTLGALPAPTIPGVGAPISVPSASSSGVNLQGASPLPGSNSGAASSGSGTVSSGSGAVSGNGAAGSGTSGTTTAGSGSSGGDSGAPARTVVTPRPQVQVPSVGNIQVPGTSGTSTAAGNATTGGAATGTASGSGAAAGTPTVTDQATTSSLPPVISTFDSGPVLSRLDRYLTQQNVSFNAVVLGPINTSILKTTDGFLVVATGQTIPNTDIVVKTVTATSVTLALGNDTKTLELDKR